MLDDGCDHHVVIVGDPGQRAVALVSAASVVHARVQDVADGHVDVVGADVLQKVDNLRAGRRHVQFGEGGIVGDGHRLAARPVFLAHAFEPVRLHERVGVGHAERRLHPSAANYVKENELNKLNRIN